MRKRGKMHCIRICLCHRKITLSKKIPALTLAIEKTPGHTAMASLFVPPTYERSVITWDITSILPAPYNSDELLFCALSFGGGGLGQLAIYSATCVIGTPSCCVLRAYLQGFILGTCWVELFQVFHN